MRDNILLADIGNSTLDLIFLGNGIKDCFKVIKTETEKIRKLLLSHNTEELYVSSVDSKGLEVLTNAKKMNVHLLTPKVMDTYASKYHYRFDNTSYLGGDLFCDAIACDCSQGLIVIDLGTASKILFVDQENYFHGCAIFPGLASFPETLNLKTDLLKACAIEEKPPLVSLVTEECISSGVINCCSAAIAGMVNRIKKEYRCPTAKVILTGGNAPLVENTLKDFAFDDFIYDKNHTIKGLCKAFELDISEEI